MNKNYNRYSLYDKQSYRKRYNNLQATIRMLKQIRRDIYEQLLEYGEDESLVKDAEYITRVIEMIKPRYLKLRNDYMYYQICERMKFMFGEAKTQPNDISYISILTKQFEDMR